MGVLECPVRDELLVYVHHGERAVALNASARAVWELCGGEHSLVEIAETLGRRFGLPGEALLEDVERAVEKLAEFGLLEAARA